MVESSSTPSAPKLGVDRKRRGQVPDLDGERLRGLQQRRDARAAVAVRVRFAGRPLSALGGEPGGPLGRLRGGLGERDRGRVERQRERRGVEVPGRDDLAAPASTSGLSPAPFSSATTRGREQVEGRAQRAVHVAARSGS